MDLTDDQRNSWQEMNQVLDAEGDSAGYREAFARWAATATLENAK